MLTAWRKPARLAWTRARAMAGDDVDAPAKRTCAGSGGADAGPSSAPGAVVDARPRSNRSSASSMSSFQTSGSEGTQPKKPQRSRVRPGARSHAAAASTTRKSVAARRIDQASPAASAGAPTDQRQRPAASARTTAGRRRRRRAWVGTVVERFARQVERDRGALLPHAHVHGASGTRRRRPGLAPRASPRKRSHTASFTLSAVNGVLRSSSFMPCACTDMLAPGTMTPSQAMRRTPSYSRFASPAFTRPTTTRMREASRDHRHAASAWRTSQKKATPPPRGRTRLMPRRFSSSASGASKPDRQLANSSRFSLSPQFRRTSGRFARSERSPGGDRCPRRLAR